MASDDDRRFPRARGVIARERIMAVLRQHKAEGLRSPTTDELGAAVGLKRTSTRAHLKWLMRDGKIRKLPGSRGIELVEPEDPPETPEATQ